MASPFEGLAAQRKRIVDQLYLDLPVPRYNAVAVRYRPIDHGAQRKRYALREKQARTTPDWEVLAACDVLIASCVGVHAVLDDGSKVNVDPDDPDGDWPTFSHGLAELLDVDGEPVTGVVRALYATDGDVLAAAAELTRWSGYRELDADEQFAGE